MQQRDEKPIQVIKPTFLPVVFLLGQLPLLLRYFVAGVGFFTALSFLLTQLMSWSFSPWSLFMFWAGVLVIVLPLLVYTIKQRTYAQTDYRFYRNRLEYAEGFWTIEHKVINYHHITQVSLRRNIIQRWYGLGNIYLSVPNLGHLPTVFSGIVLQDIANSNEVYQTIQTLIKPTN